MGRKKIKIEKIPEARNRNVTFTKRRGGLTKKAMELSMLCDCKVALLIVDEQGRLFEYVSDGNMEGLLQEREELGAPIESRHNEDYEYLYGDRQGTAAPPRTIRPAAAGGGSSSGAGGGAGGRRTSSRQRKASAIAAEAAASFVAERDAEASDPEPEPAPAPEPQVVGVPTGGDADGGDDGLALGLANRPENFVVTAKQQRAARKLNRRFDRKPRTVMQAPGVEGPAEGFVGGVL